MAVYILIWANKDLQSTLSENYFYQESCQILFGVIRFYRLQENYKNLSFFAEIAISDFGQSIDMKIRNRFCNQAEIPNLKFEFSKISWTL